MCYLGAEWWESKKSKRVKRVKKKSNNILVFQCGARVKENPTTLDALSKVAVIWDSNLQN